MLASRRGIYLRCSLRHDNLEAGLNLSNPLLVFGNLLSRGPKPLPDFYKDQTEIKVTLREHAQVHGHYTCGSSRLSCEGVPIPRCRDGGVYRDAKLKSNWKSIEVTSNVNSKSK